MSKSARIATLSSLASRSSLTPPAVSSASPKNTLTPPLKWKPQKQAPPRNRPLGARVILNPSVENGEGSQPSLITLNSFGTVIPDCPSFFFHISSRSPPTTGSAAPLSAFSSFLPTFNSRLSTSLRSPPVYNELPSWLLNPACSIARGPAN